MANHPVRWQLTALSAFFIAGCVTGCGSASSANEAPPAGSGGSSLDLAANACDAMTRADSMAGVQEAEATASRAAQSDARWLGLATAATKLVADEQYFDHLSDELNAGEPIDWDSLEQRARANQNRATWREFTAACRQVRDAGGNVDLTELDGKFPEPD